MSIGEALDRSQWSFGLDGKRRLHVKIGMGSTTTSLAIGIERVAMITGSIAIFTDWYRPTRSAACAVEIERVAA